MQVLVRNCVLCAFAVLLGGCGTFGRPREPVGTLKGTLQIEWVGADRFVYRPLESDPIRYSVAGRMVEPGPMYTDGGSIPRIFWSQKGLSPWTYGPAYIVHDWLFNEHRCGRDVGDKRWSFAEANDALYDSIAILEKNRTADGGEAPRLIKLAVDRFGKAAWQKGECNKIPPALITRPTFDANRRAAPPSGVIVGTITVRP